MRRLFLAAAMLAALLIPAASASAAPTGAYANYAQCPLSNPALEACFFSESTGGSVTTGSKTVPVENPQVVQGGLDYVVPGELLGPINFIGAANGQTIVPTPQPVPGGLLGITAPAWWPKFIRDWFNGLINEGFTGVTATVELAGPASAIKLSFLNAFIHSGSALEMPVKIKLGNAILGNNCYIGSNSNPIVWKLTTGTTAPPPPNTPISGASGTPGIVEEGNILQITGAKLVDNSFAVPGASGCGGIFSFLVDPLVNSTIGVPAAAGKNTAILENDLEIAVPSAVEASDP
jgi:hypothetical protein